MKSFHSAYLSESEKYLRASAQSPATIQSHRRLVRTDHGPGDLACLHEMCDANVELVVIDRHAAPELEHEG